MGYLIYFLIIIISSYIHALVLIVTENKTLYKR